MTFFENLKAELRDSFSTLLGTNGPALIDEETSLAFNKTIKKRMSGIIRNTHANKSREMMDAISAAIDQDEDRDSKEIRAAPFKLTKRVSSKKLLTAKMTKMPSVTELINKPLASEDIVKGEEAIKYYELSGFSDISGKDLNRSFGSLMMDKNTLDSKKKKKGKSESKNSVSKLSRMGSIQSIVNFPLNNDGMSDPPSKPDIFSPLGITAADLYKSFDDGLENALAGKETVKVKGSIADVINAPLNEEYGPIEDITAPIKEVSLTENVAAIIRGEETYLFATKNELENDQSTTVNISMEEVPLIDTQY